MNLIFKWENDLNNTTVLYQIYFHTPPRDEVFILWVNNSLQQSKLRYIAQHRIKKNVLNEMQKMDYGSERPQDLKRPQMKTGTENLLT